MSNFKPQGFSTVSPYLVSKTPEASIKFMESVLGAQINDKQVDPQTGDIVHASLVLDDSIIMISGASEGWPARPAHVHVYVSNVDSAFAKAISAGAIAVQDPVKHSEREDKRCGVLDTGGTTWWLATHGA